ncbi:MAG: hypothetical protein ACM3O6_13950 [Acidobacteriota bacterium]
MTSIVLVFPSSIARIAERSLRLAGFLGERNPVLFSFCDALTRPPPSPMEIACVVAMRGHLSPRPFGGKTTAPAGGLPAFS